MELLIALMYLAGLGVVIWWMAHISRFATWAAYQLFPPRYEKRQSTAGHAARLAEEMNREYCTTKERGAQDVSDHCGKCA